MRDFLLTTSDEKLYFLDINVINGYPEYVHFEGQTQDQRAAVAAVMQLGTIPGMLDTGVDWTETLTTSPKSSMVSLDNQVKQNVKSLASREKKDGSVSQYIPLYIPNDSGSVSVTLMRG